LPLPPRAGIVETVKHRQGPFQRLPAAALTIDPCHARLDRSTAQRPGFWAEARPRRAAMMTTRLRRVVDDLTINLAFYTRLPLACRLMEGSELARASWAAPFAGAIVGLLGAMAYWLARAAQLPAWPAAVLAVAATLAVTGCLHEDGLADVADALGGTSRERKLDIMRDSRLGTYGASALIASMMLRVSALASLMTPASAAIALIVAHMAGRAAIPGFMRLIPPARTEGLSAGAGPAPRASAAIAATVGIVALMAGLPWRCALLALAAAAAALFVIARLSIKHFGGQTGDVLGAVEQCVEIAVLLGAATQMGATALTP
jgi:adenosylcobinamide-GDP ribazoletransferase